jgi:hypothetical protein
MKSNLDNILDRLHLLRRDLLSDNLSLLRSHRHLLSSKLLQLVQLLCSHFAHISEQQNERQLHSLLGHHQEALHQQALQDLRANALEQAAGAFVHDDVVHDFDEGLEGLAVAGWRRARLQAYFGHNEWLGCDCC